MPAILFFCRAFFGRGVFGVKSIAFLALGAALFYFVNFAGLNSKPKRRKIFSIRALKLSMKKLLYLLLLLAIVSCKDEAEKVGPASEPVSAFQQLTNYPEGVGSVVISDDGRTIFYTVSKNRDSMGNYNVDLYSMNSDGSNQKKLLNFPSATGIGLPILSTNNQKLAFIVSKRTNTGSGREKSFMIGNFDGTGMITLPNISDVAQLKAFVDNNQSILYSSSGIVNGCACNTIMKLSLNDSTIKMLSGNGGMMAVSKDRSLILFESNNKDAFTMDTDGQNLLKVGSNFVPWDISPDNSTMLLHKVMPWNNGTNAVQMFVSNATGTSAKQLTNTEGTSLPHGFFPNGQEILFRYYIGSSGLGNSELYLIKPDGTGQIRLTNNNVDEVPFGFLENSRKVLLTLEENRIYNLYSLDL